MRCGLCGYEWESRSKGDPKQCPRCKRYDWKPKNKKPSLMKLYEKIRKIPPSEEELIRLSDKE